MFGYKTMSAYRFTGSGGTLLLLNVHHEMLRPVVFGGLERIWRLHPKATDGTIGNILCELIEYVQVSHDSKVTDNAFENTRDTLHTDTAWHAFAARFLR